MLPSTAFQALAKSEIVAVVRSADAGCAELRAEFGIPYLNSWVVVLNGQGETLASWIGDAAGAGCDENSAGKFARNLVAGIRKSLQREESVQELERRWQRNPRDMAAFESLARRLEEMHAQGRLRQLCEEAAANPRLARQRRDEFRLRAFTARAADSTGDLSSRRARTQFLRDGERLLVTLASHPQATDLVRWLFYAGYARGFDVPARSARGIARLQRAARKMATAGPLQERIDLLTEMRREWLEHTTEQLQRLGDASVKSYIAAQLGDAAAAIKLFSRPPYKGHPESRVWLQEAKRKHERERKRAGVSGA